MRREGDVPSWTGPDAHAVSAPQRPAHAFGIRTRFAVVVDERLMDDAGSRQSPDGDSHENSNARPVLGTLYVLSRSVQGIDPDADVIGIRIHTGR